MDELHPRFNILRPATTGAAAGAEVVPWVEMPLMLEAVLAALQVRGDPEALDEYAPLVEMKIPGALKVVAPDGFDVRGRTGVGDVADVPWVGLFPPSGGTSAKQGIYVVFLFSYDGGALYLSLNQGTENVKGGKAALRKRALDIRAVVGAPSDLLMEIDLRSTNERPKRYEAGNAYAIRYDAGSVPEAKSLRQDLDRMLALLDKVLTSELEFSPSLEPVHLLMKWSAERKAATLAEHKAMADGHGAVWWGKLGTPGTTAMSDARLESVRSQLELGVETHCYLYRRGEVWRTRVLQITSNPDDVDVERLPGYSGTGECNLFVLVTGFHELPADWPVTHLVLTSNPTPEAIVGALGNQTSPLLVYELFGDPAEPSPTSADTDPPQPPPSSLTPDWLVGATLLERDEVEEMVNALQRRRQVILAGPPGTSKTWIAKALARYVTVDAPLAYRLLQFHPSYGYEEFMEGLRPVAEAGSIKFQRQDGAVLRMSNQIEESTDQLHVLVLDEMNRANLPRVFGELMYLLEYRNESVDLMYSDDFSLPDKLLFIGTMNTADRSIRSIDIALRRRFEIFELPPSAAILTRYYKENTNHVPDLIDGFLRLNQRLTAALDRHHTIGHSFFMREVFTTEALQETWHRQLFPLIEEYFFDQPDIAATFQLHDFWPSALPPAG